MNRAFVKFLVVVVMVGCQQGPKGDTGAQGAAGVAGPTGPVGPVAPVGADGAVGPAGSVGPRGEVLVLSAADGSTVAIDAGLAIVAGPVGAQGPMGLTGPTGAQGPQGLPGTTGADGAVGPAGPAGPSSGVLIVAADGGVEGTMAGSVFFSSKTHCGIDTVGIAIPSVQLCWTNPDCTGVPYVGGLSYPAQGMGLLSGSIVGRCFNGSGNQGLGGTFRVSEPVQRVTVQLWSCYRHNQSICDLQSPAVTGGYAVDRLTAVPSFPPDDGFTLRFP